MLNMYKYYHMEKTWLDKEVSKRAMQTELWTGILNIEVPFERKRKKPPPY